MICCFFTMMLPGFDFFLLNFIIGLIIFLFANFLLRFFITNHRKRKLVSWVSTIILTPMIYFALIRLFMFYITYEPTRDFDQSRWLDNVETRFHMASDIIESGMLIGKDSNQLKRMLGEPLERFSYQSNHRKGHHWEYAMGQGGGGFGIQLHFLTISFDNNRRVDTVTHGRLLD